jgi:hypothetical protein
MNFYEISTLLQGYLPLAALVLTLVLGQWRSSRLRFALIFLIASYLINSSAYVFGIYYYAGRFIGEYFDMTLILALSWMYHKDSPNKSFLTFGGLLLLSYCLIRLTLQPSNTSPNISSVTGNIVVIILCFRYLYVLIQSEVEIGIDQNILFSHTIIVLFYEAGGFFCQLLIEYINFNNGERSYLYFIQVWVAIITYLAFSYLIGREYFLHKKGSTGP